MGLFDQQQPNQGLMGLGQQPQAMQEPQRMPAQSFFSGSNAGQVPTGMSMVNGEFVPNGQPQQGLNPYATNRGLPMPQNPNYMGQQPNIQEEFGVPSPFYESRCNAITSSNAYKCFIAYRCVR
jgi:hypothetical protein